MSPRRTLLLAAGLAVLGAAPASAAQVEVKGSDALSWDKPEVTVAQGDSVVWSFAGTTQIHNVASASPNWSYASVLDAPAPNGTFTFDAPGVYAFVCQVHSGMTGAVTVTGPSGEPPPSGSGAPPPPPGQQPLPSDMPEPGPLETGGLDEHAPSLSAMRVRRSGGVARLRFRVSEPSAVTIRFKRGDKVVATRHVRAAGTVRVTVPRSLAAGRYRVELRARDGAGNASRLRSARLTVR